MKSMKFLISLAMGCVFGKDVVLASSTKEGALTSQSMSLSGGSKSPPKNEAPKVSFVPSMLYVNEPTKQRRVIVNNKTKTSQNFLIHQIKIKGNTVYSGDFIAGFLSHLLNRSSTPEELTQALEKIIQHYWNDGYVLAEVRVSIKDMHDGDHRITLHVNEGVLSEVKVDGGSASVRSLLQSYIQLLQREKPFRMDKMEYYDNLLKSFPGLTIEGDVYHLVDKVGEGGIHFKVSERKFVPYASIDNRGSEYIGPIRTAVGASSSSLFRSGDLTSALFMFTPNNDELRYGRATHVTPVGTNGATLNLRGEYGETKPGFILTNSKIKGKAYYLEAFYNHLTYAFPNQQVNWRVGVEALGYQAKVPTQLLYKDNLRTFIVGGTTSFIDLLKARNIIDVKFSQGVGVLGASTNKGDDRSIENGRAAYTKIGGEWTRSQTLFQPVSLVTRVEGQRSFHSLLAGAQFVCGGASYLSGYDSGDFRGDHGLAGRAELRYGFNPGDDYPVHKGHVYTFYDGGKVWNRSVLRASNPISSISGTSAGLGIRFTYVKKIGIGLELSKPLTRRLPSRIPFPQKRQRPWRVFFKIELKY